MCEDFPDVVNPIMLLCLAFFFNPYSLIRPRDILFILGRNSKFYGDICDVGYWNKFPPPPPLQQ